MHRITIHDDFDLQCLNNGVTYTKISEEGPSVDVLEMFFSGFSRIIGMHHFPNIHTLTIIGQSISQIVGLTPLSKLRELWVAECQVEVSKCVCSYKCICVFLHMCMCACTYVCVQERLKTGETWKDH